MGYPIYHSAYTAAQIEAAIGKGPRVNAAGYWEVWNVSTGAYESTGVGAGVQPPTVVTQVSQMTNHGYIYIYNGTETGYTAGYWYYWDGSAWATGGAYQVAATDTTLSVAGAAADAKVTGNEINGLKSVVDQQLVGSKHFKDGNSYLPCKCERGAISSGSDVSTGYQYRVRTVGMISFDSMVTLFAKDGFRFAIYYYANDGTYTTVENNLTREIINANQKFRLMIVRNPENPSEIADPVEFSSAIYYETVVANIKEEISGLYSATKSANETGWVAGYIRDNGRWGESSASCRTGTRYINNTNKVVVTVKTGYLVTIGMYSANDQTTFIDFVAKETAEQVTLYPGYYYVFGIKTADGSALIPSDVASDAIVKTSYYLTDTTLTKKNKAADAETVGNKITEISGRTEGIYTGLQAGEIPEGVKFVRGSVNAATGAINTSINYRASTEEIITAEKNYMLKSADGFKYAVTVYFSDDSVAGSFGNSNSGWEFAVSKGMRYRLTVMKVMETTSVPADLDVFSKAVFIQTAKIQNLIDITTGTAYGDNIIYTINSGIACIKRNGAESGLYGALYTGNFEEGKMYYLSAELLDAKQTVVHPAISFVDTSGNRTGGRAFRTNKKAAFGQFGICPANCAGVLLTFDTNITTREYDFINVYAIESETTPTTIEGSDSAFKDSQARRTAEKAKQLALFNGIKTPSHQIRRPLVSIIDDDGNHEFYTYIFPMIRDYNVPIATAYMGNNNFSDYNINQIYMSAEELREVEEAGGEVITHTTGNLAEMTAAAGEAMVVKGKRLMEANGFYNNQFVYSNGGSNEAVRAMISKYYDAGYITIDTSDDYRTNFGIIADYRIKRVHCGGAGYDPIVTTGRYANLDTASIEYFEALIDECIENNSWLVLYTHSFQMANGQRPTGGGTQFEFMRKIIEYILDQGVEIAKCKDAFDVFGNAWQAGDYLGDRNNDMTLHSHKGCAVSKTGEFDFPNS